MNRYNSVSVLYEGKKVGTLAMGSDHIARFEYDAGWLADGFAISPFSLPLRQGVFTHKSADLFDGVFGVFADSLPDGWGRVDCEVPIFFGLRYFDAADHATNPGL